MAKYCEICKKGITSGNTVSHSNRKAKRTWSPNVQRVRAIIDDTPKNIYVCTRCLRSGKIVRG